MTTPSHPLYNKTYTLHALTPLHLFPPPTATALAPHALQLLQLLRGDTLRGVALPSTTSTHPKPLTCTWAPLAAPHGGIEITLTFDDGGGSPPSSSALLLGPNLHLLLTRLPPFAHAALLHYLSTTFDTLVLPLGLGDRFLRRAVEHAGGVGEAVLTFEGAGEGLRRVTVTVGEEDVGGLRAREGGFWGALGEHLEAVCGVRVTEVVLVKAAVGRFVLGAEGKGKFFEGGEGAVEMVLEEAGRRGRGEGAEA